ncbi:MAG: hypothetical protein RL217_1663 [Pseudomonadota bacterium]
MERYEWQDSLNLGITAIDKQHRKILDYINALSHAIEFHQRAEVAQVLTQLTHYALEHFRFEEELMAQAGYSLFQAHQATHQRFEQKIQQLQQEFNEHQDADLVAAKTRTWLLTWLIKHIQYEDAAYAPAVIIYLQQDNGARFAQIERNYSVLH